MAENSCLTCAPDVPVLWPDGQVYTLRVTDRSRGPGLLGPPASARSGLSGPALHPFLAVLLGLALGSCLQSHLPGVLKILACLERPHLQAHLNLPLFLPAGFILTLVSPVFTWGALGRLRGCPPPSLPRLVGERRQRSVRRGRLLLMRPRCLRCGLLCVFAAYFNSVLSFDSFVTLQFQKANGVSRTLLPLPPPHSRLLTVHSILVFPIPDTSY